MTFENPSAAWWALIAVPVLILYLARLNIHREAVGTGMFWRQVLPKTNPLLRRVASLVAQLAIIGLIVVGLTQLYLAPDIGSRRVVVVVDNSPSMQAEHDGKSRLALAIEKARGLIAKLRIGDQMAVYVTSPVMRPICRTTGHRQQLRDSLAEISAATHQSHSHVGLPVLPKHRNENLQVILIGDGCHRLADGIASNYRFVQVGEPLENIAITRIATRRGLFDTTIADVMIELESHADESVGVPLTVTLNGAKLAREEVSVPPNSVWRKTFRVGGVPGGLLGVEIESSDRLAADNVATVELPPLRQTTVEVVGTAPESLLRALSAVPRIRIAQNENEPADIQLYYNASPPGDAVLPALVINPSENTRQWQIGEYRYDAEISQNNNSPLVRGLSLDEAVYERVRSLMPSGDIHVAASGTTGSGDIFPLLFSQDANPRRIVFAADLEQSDLVHRDDLPRLLANSFAWLRPSIEHSVGVSPINDHELRPSEQLASIALDSRSDLLEYPWWHWPCWYFSIALAVALLPIEWWLYQRRMIA